jgi:hypothetical protein
LKIEMGIAVVNANTRPNIRASAPSMWASNVRYEPKKLRIPASIRVRSDSVSIDP